jgi:hypothetical protein
MPWHHFAIMLSVVKVIVVAPNTLWLQLVHCSKVLIKNDIFAAETTNPHSIWYFAAFECGANCYKTFYIHN